MQVNTVVDPGPTLSPVRVSDSSRNTDSSASNGGSDSPAAAAIIPGVVNVNEGNTNVSNPGPATRNLNSYAGYTTTNPSTIASSTVKSNPNLSSKSSQQLLLETALVEDLKQRMGIDYLDFSVD